MRDQHPLDWPSQNFVEGDPCRAAIKEACTPITWRTRIRGDDPAIPSEESPPSFEPIGCKILDQIGEEGGAAALVKEHNLCERKATAKDDLRDVSRPFGFGGIMELGIEV
jgi:hypothetical protein